MIGRALKLRRARQPSGQQRAIALLLHSLADRVGAGAARANLRVEAPGTALEVWLVAATVPGSRGRK